MILSAAGINFDGDLADSDLGNFAATMAGLHGDKPCRLQLG